MNINQPLTHYNSFEDREFLITQLLNALRPTNNHGLVNEKWRYEFYDL